MRLLTDIYISYNGLVFLLGLMAGKYMKEGTTSLVLAWSFIAVILIFGVKIMLQDYIISFPKFPVPVEVEKEIKRLIRNSAVCGGMNSFIIGVIIIAMGPGIISVLTILLLMVYIVFAYRDLKEVVNSIK